MEIGEFIKEKREAAGLSQKELANRSGLKHDSLICHIESGARKVKWEELANISKALGNFHIFEGLLIAGYITEDDLHPIMYIHHLEKLDSNDLKEVQEFVNYLIYKKLQNEKSD